MPYITAQLTDVGPVVDLIVGVTDAKRALMEKHQMVVPSRQTIKALVDTGSGLTILRPSTVQHLDLSSTGKKVVESLSGKHTYDEYDVSLSLIGYEGVEMHFPYVAVIGTPFAGENDFQALLGRDILAYCLFVYDGQSDSFSLAY